MTAQRPFIPTVIALLLSLLFVSTSCGQTTQPTLKSGTIQFDGTTYRYTLTPAAAPPATPPPVVNAAPVFKVLPYTAVAPATVHVNALDVPLASGTSLTAKYEWDFGDASPTAKLRGWTAAHVYDAPGQYNLALRITDDAGTVTTHMLALTIRGDNRRAWHVAADGDDTNPGTPDRPIRTFARAVAAVGNNTAIRFRRGDRFDVPETLAMNVRHQNVVIGAYGDQTKSLPILWKLPGKQERIVITMFKPASDVVIEDLCFDGPYAVEPGKMAPKIPNDPIHPAGNNITVRRCVFLNVNDAVNTQRNVTGFFFEGNSAPLETGLRSYMVWGQGSDHVYLNNTCVNSTREHGFRVNGTTRVLIAGNTMGNIARADAGDKEDIVKGSIEMHSGSYAYIANNRVTSGSLRLGPRGGDAEPADTATDWCVVEDNTLENVSIGVRPGTHDTVVRNNVVRNVEGIRIFNRDKDGRTSRDIVIDHNTMIAAGETAQFLVVEGTAERITLTNNLLVAPNMYAGKNASATVYVGARDLSCFTTIASNVWPLPTRRTKLAGTDGAFYVAPKWDDPAGYVSLERWRTFPQVKDDVAMPVDVDQTGQPNLAATNRAVGALQSR